MLAYRGLYGSTTSAPHQTLEQSLKKCYGKLVSMQGGADEALESLPKSKPSQQVGTSFNMVFIVVASLTRF